MNIVKIDLYEDDIFNKSVRRESFQNFFKCGLYIEIVYPSIMYNRGSQCVGHVTIFWGRRYFTKSKQIIFLVYIPPHSRLCKYVTWVKGGIK